MKSNRPPVMIVSRPPICCVCGKRADDGSAGPVVGWLGIVHDDGRDDYCPKCRKQVEGGT